MLDLPSAMGTSAIRKLVPKLFCGVQQDTLEVRRRRWTHVARVLKQNSHLHGPPICEPHSPVAINQVKLESLEILTELLNRFAGLLNEARLTYGVFYCIKTALENKDIPSTPT